MEFKEFPKMPRLSRDMIITEKIDGTNGSVFIQNEVLETAFDEEEVVARKDGYTMRVGSRTRWITPKDNNYGFAKWVLQNSDELFKLGEGLHFGEWWGSGIQRSYGLLKGEKRFSLFNVSRWKDDGKDIRPASCHVVPVIYEGSFDTKKAEECLFSLSQTGSLASPGFMRPEGIIVYHVAGNLGFKKTIEKDEVPKSLIK